MKYPFLILLTLPFLAHAQETLPNTTDVGRGNPAALAAPTQPAPGVTQGTASTNNNNPPAPPTTMMYNSSRTPSDSQLPPGDTPVNSNSTPTNAPPTSTTIHVPSGSNSGGSASANANENNVEPQTAPVNARQFPQVQTPRSRPQNARARAPAPTRSASQRRTPETSRVAALPVTPGAGLTPTNSQAAEADLAVTTNIRRDLLARNPALLHSVTVSPQNGSIVLRGSVSEPQDRDFIYGIARWHAQSVPVKNEISVKK